MPLPSINYTVTKRANMKITLEHIITVLCGLIVACSWFYISLTFWVGYLS